MSPTVAWETAKKLMHNFRREARLPKHSLIPKLEANKRLEGLSQYANQAENGKHKIPLKR